MFQPMSLGELLDAAFTIYRRHFRVLVGIAAICNGPFQALNLYAGITGGWLEHLPLAIVALLSASIGTLIGSAAILKVVSEGYLGRDCKVGDALSFAVGRILPLMLAGFARYTLAMLALMLFVIPGIIVWCGYAVVGQIVVLEEPPRALDALGRSWELTRGHRWTAFALIFILALVAAIPGFAAGVLVALGLGTVALTIGAITALTLAPLMPCGVTLYYYDLRVRKEAFDLQMLGQLIGDGAAA